MNRRLPAPLPSSSLPRLLRSALVLLLVSAPAAALAQAPQWPPALIEGLQRSNTVITARMDAETAAREARRSQGDPFATRAQQERAQRGGELAAAQLRQTEADALRQAVSAYAATLEAQDARDLAQAQLELRQREWEAEQVRLQVGVSTAAQLEDAVAALDQAVDQLTAAEEELATAWADLRSQVPELSEPLLPLPQVDVTAMPEREVFLAAAGGRVEVLRAEHALADAEQALLAAHPSFTAPREREAAEEDRAAALASLEDTITSAESNVRASADTAQAALRRWLLAEGTLERSEERYRQQRSRFEEGLISPLELDGEALTLMQRRHELRAAAHAALLAVMQLHHAVGLDTPLAETTLP